jgi:dynein intermediate chain 2, axonemal
MPAQPSTSSLKLSNVPLRSEMTVSTEKVQVVSRGQNHREGGWPKDIDPSEPQDTMKWRKRLDKDPAFTNTLKGLLNAAQETLDENACIDMFERYFDENETTLSMQNLSVSTLIVFKDAFKRKVNKICWHPESGMTKFLATYASNEHFSASIWDSTSTGAPIQELFSQVALTSAAFYAKNPDLVGAGTQSGLLQYYDLRSGNRPVSRSGFQNSHAEAVTDFAWLQSKTHSECVTTSVDGKVLWWDIRNLSAPTDELVLAVDNQTKLGGLCLEWMQEAGPSKYLVGTEEGVALGLSKKPKKAIELGGWHGVESKGGHGGHHGPVYSIKRNPHHVKFFMTVGDWCVKVWLDELKSPLFQTTKAKSPLSCGGWSQTKPGVLFTGRQDGFVDLWDFSYRLNEVALSFKVSDHKLTAANLNSSGNLLLCGDNQGGISLSQFPPELSNGGNYEKSLLGSIFEREARREKGLEVSKKVTSQMVKAKTDENVNSQPDDPSFLQRERSWLNQMQL